MLAWMYLLNQFPSVLLMLKVLFLRAVRLAEREEMSRGLRVNYSLRETARQPTQLVERPFHSNATTFALNKRHYKLPCAGGQCAAELSVVRYYFTGPTQIYCDPDFRNWVVQEKSNPAIGTC